MSDVRVEPPTSPGLKGFLERIKQNQESANLAMRQAGFSGAPVGPNPYEQAKSQRSAEWWTSQQPSPSNVLDRFIEPTLTASTEDLGVLPDTGAVGPTGPQMSQEEYYAQLLARMGLGGGGGGAARPDFSAYRQALTGQAEELNARIQAMYNQLGEQAGANVGRIQDIYGGAQTGVGDIYDSAAGNIGQAFSSSQQQAADQMARLGIEAAAPAVMDPMALSQAQALSGLEGGRASGLSALERYGATASDFGSQMAQTAQQQGTEMNAAILASLQNRLADSLAAEQAGGGGGGGGGGMSVSDQLKLMQFADQKYRQDVLGELPLDERKFAAERADAIIRNSRSDEEAFLKLVTPDRASGKPLMSPEEAEDAIRYARETFAPNFGPNF
jgi:hypothetical protein